MNLTRIVGQHVFSNDHPSLKCYISDDEVCDSELTKIVKAFRSCGVMTSLTELRELMEDVV